ESDGGQNANDRHNDHQFDQGKALLNTFHSCVSSPGFTKTPLWRRLGNAAVIKQVVYQLGLYARETRTRFNHDWDCTLCVTPHAHRLSDANGMTRFVQNCRCTAHRGIQKSDAERHFSTFRGADAELANVKVTVASSMVSPAWSVSPPSGRGIPFTRGGS